MKGKKERVGRGEREGEGDSGICMWRGRGGG